MAAQRNDLRELASLAQNATDDQREMKVIAVHAIHNALHVDAVMNALTPLISHLSNHHMRPILDALIRRHLQSGHISAAFRGEHMSRLLEIPLSRYTYTSLIANTKQLEIALALFHRAIAIGLHPSRTMLNNLLDVLLHNSQYTRATAVLRVLHNTTGLNAHTIHTLLQYRPAQRTMLDRIFHLLSTPTCTPTPAMVTLLISRFIECNHLDSAFSTIEHFHSLGILTPPALLDRLILACIQENRLEAALTAWRERRKGWAGNPARRARRALWRALCERGAGRDEYLTSVLEEGVGEAELSRMRRGLRMGDSEMEWDILNDEESDVRDRAWVLYRWIQEGREREVGEYISELESVHIKILACLIKCGEWGEKLFLDRLSRVPMEREQKIEMATKLLGGMRKEVERAVGAG